MYTLEWSLELVEYDALSVAWYIFSCEKVSLRDLPDKPQVPSVYGEDRDLHAMCPTN